MCEAEFDPQHHRIKLKIMIEGWGCVTQVVEQVTEFKPKYHKKKIGHLLPIL
jgi:hypothetical protein